MASGRELASFPIPPAQRSRLSRAGFRTVEDVVEMSALELAQELSIPNEEALELLEIFRSGVERKGDAGAAPAVKDRSALDMLRQERTQPPIVTFCDAWDQMLGGGVPLGKITEFCGPPGVGKTQLGIQLAVDVQIPQCFGGVEGEVVYIDTEGSFVAERARDIAAAAVDHIHNVVADPSNDEQVAAAGAYDVNEVLSKIHLFRVHTYHEQIAAIHLLHSFCKEHPRVRLVVVDSVAFHFRQEFSSMALRTRLLHGMAQSLMKLASENNIAIVLMNQMTTKLGDGAGRSQLVPALGESWGHASTIRVVMSWQQGQRHATLFKSPSMSEQTIQYSVTGAGVRDLWAESEHVAKKSRTDAS